MYVYVNNKENNTFDVGFFTYSGEWVYSGFSYKTPYHASMKVHYLNGGNLNNSEFAILLN